MTSLQLGIFQDRSFNLVRGARLALITGRKNDRRNKRKNLKRLLNQNKP